MSAHPCIGHSHSSATVGGLVRRVGVQDVSEGRGSCYAVTVKTPHQAGAVVLARVGYASSIVKCLAIRIRIDLVIFAPGPRTGFGSGPGSCPPVQPLPTGSAYQVRGPPRPRTGCRAVRVVSAVAAAAAAARLNGPVPGARRAGRIRLPAATLLA